MPAKIACRIRERHRRRPARAPACARGRVPTDSLIRRSLTRRISNCTTPIFRPFHRSGGRILGLPEGRRPLGRHRRGGDRITGLMLPLLDSLVPRPDPHEDGNATTPSCYDHGGIVEDAVIRFSAEVRWVGGPGDRNSGYTSRRRQTSRQEPSRHDPCRVIQVRKSREILQEVLGRSVGAVLLVRRSRRVRCARHHPAQATRPNSATTSGVCRRHGAKMFADLWDHSRAHDQTGGQKALNRAWKPELTFCKD